MCQVCLPQTIKVIQLTPDEVRTALSFKAEEDQTKVQLEKIKQARQKFELTIEHRYISEQFPTRASACIVLPGDKDCTPPAFPLVDQIGPDKSWQRKDAWINGFEYSEDYKYIVPKPIYKSGECMCYYGTILSVPCPCAPLPEGVTENPIGGMFVNPVYHGIEFPHQGATQ